jgi:hypothetical protein
MQDVAVYRKQDIVQYGHLIVPIMTVLGQVIRCNMEKYAGQIKVKSGKSLSVKTMAKYYAADRAEPRVIFQLVCLFYDTPFFLHLRQIPNFNDFFNKFAHLCSPNSETEYRKDFAQLTSKVMEFIDSLKFPEDDKDLAKLAEVHEVSIKEVRKGMNLKQYYWTLPR